ncbi:hypothetical protein ACSBR2_001909 [Camellia fascicularis]
MYHILEYVVYHLSVPVPVPVPVPRIGTIHVSDEWLIPISVEDPDSDEVTGHIGMKGSYRLSYYVFLLEFL